MISSSSRLSGSFHLIAAALATMLLASACATPAEEPELTQAASELGKPPAEPRALSCEDQCTWAGYSCPTDCGASFQECAAATQTCYRSCENGVGPWLPC